MEKKPSRLLPITAMLLVALECFYKGAGVSNQDLFSESMLWIWYLVGFLWVWSVVIFFYETK